MPEKTVREMTALERRHYSLEARMFHAVEMASAILGLVALLIGLGLVLQYADSVTGTHTPDVGHLVLWYGVHVCKVHALFAQVKLLQQVSRELRVAFRHVGYEDGV